MFYLYKLSVRATQAPLLVLNKGACLLIMRYYYPHPAVVLLLPSIQGWEAWPHLHLDETLNPLTSVKPVMNKLQHVFVALVNVDIFQMTLKLSLFTVDLYRVIYVTIF